MSDYTQLLVWCQRVGIPVLTESRNEVDEDEELIAALPMSATCRLTMGDSMQGSQMSAPMWFDAHGVVLGYEGLDGTTYVPLPHEKGSHA